MRPKYKEYQRRILEFLVTRTDAGPCPMSNLRVHCKIPKSSLSNVLAEMEKQAYVRLREKWWNKQRAVVITETGRNFYNSIIAEPAKYGLPYSIQSYLGKRSPKVSKLFPIQEAFLNRGLLSSSDNVCVFAYPGSGKTLLAEMAMIQALNSGGRALYCTPYKALDWQKFQEFSRSFSKVGLNVVVTDGDSPTRLDELNKANIIIGTYERVKGALRRQESWLSKIDFLCADEITLLADRSRGSSLDFLLTLLKERKNTRVITLSSIVGNALQISKWLNAKPIIDNRPLSEAGVEESVVSKEQGEIVYRYRDGREKREIANEDMIQHLVRNNVQSKNTTLIFVGPRDAAPELAERLKCLHAQDDELVARVADFRSSSPYFEDTSLTRRACELIKFGVAFHHAGLHKRVRRFIENLLSEGKLVTIVATGTLSHGVDFKIDSVIVDLESIESVHSRDEFHRFEYINYKGRAGRPGKSSLAAVFLVCNAKHAEDTFSKYFLGMPEPVVPETLQHDELCTIALSLGASHESIDFKQISDVVQNTLSAISGQVKIRNFRPLLNDLVAKGFIEKQGSNHCLTQLGERTNKADITPSDALKILEIADTTSPRDLISKAVGIDLVLNYRLSGARHGDPSSMLFDWIEESPIDAIKEKYKGYWDDGDVLLLGEYTAIALDKISTFLSNKRMHGMIETLSERLRFGVKEDIVRAKFTQLSIVRKNKARFFARALIDKGYKDLKQLSEEDASKLSKALSVSQVEARNLINECEQKCLNSY